MKEPNERIQSIDVLRGLVMLLMALDHVRDYTNKGYMFIDPTNLDATTPGLFMTRWITHFCAPVFVFLAGTSAFLYGAKRQSKKNLSRFLWTRGLWLILVELTIVNFSWTFDISLSVHIFQVIWAIGICMIFLSFLIFFNKKVLLGLGFVIVVGHNLLDSITAQGTDSLSLLWYFTHQFQFQVINDGTGMLAIAYPFLPWLGIMILGYCFGHYYQKGFAPLKRRRFLLLAGTSAILLFFLLRAINVYGDLKPWEVKDSFTYSLLSFINVTKYPPSLQYVCITLGPALLFLYAVELVRNQFTKVMVTIGRVPFFYYVIHLYLIHIIGLFGLLILGEDWKELILTVDNFKRGYLYFIGFDLWVSYLVWILVCIVLYPLCKRYMTYKANNRDKWWLSYL